MSIRIPNRPNIGAAEIRRRDSDILHSIARVFKSVSAGDLVLVWEQTSFVDKNGKAFYDKNGVPFQGKH